MELPKLKKLKPSYTSLNTIGRVGYELTGNGYFLTLSQNASFSVQSGATFFEAYYILLNQVLESAKDEDYFKHNLVKFKSDGGTIKVPFVYNSL